jgi:hypothetical protein
VQAAAEEGVVAYKNLLGPGQNMSHVPGADVEAQEINTVADMVNFEMKKKMYRRFSTGFGVFMVGQLCECPVGALGFAELWGQGAGGGLGSCVLDCMRLLTGSRSLRAAAPTAD